MKYMLMIYDPADYWDATEDEQTADYEQQVSFSAWLREQGITFIGEALQSPTTSTTLRTRDGETTITDGPFIELKEVLGGFYLFDAPDLDAAIAIAKRCPAANIELRPVWE